MQATKYEILFNIILYLIIILISYKVIRKCISRKQAKSRIVYILIMMFLLSVFAFHSGDYFHMKEGFASIKSGEASIESPYFFIANNLSFNYLSFRIVVWGLVLFFVKQTYMRLSSDYLPLFIIALLCTLTLSYARVSLAMALMFYGYSYIIKPSSNTLLSFVIGLFFIFISFFFHKSAVFGIIILLISLLLIRRINKYAVALVALSIPLLLYYLRFFVSDFLSNTNKYDTIIDTERGLRYMNSEYASSYGIAMIIQNILSWTPYYIVFFIILSIIFKGKYETIDQKTKMLGNVVFFIVFISTFFGLVDFGVNTNVFFYRFLYFAMIPMCYFLAYCLRYNIHKKLVYLSIIIGVASSFYTLLYRYYLV